MIHLTCMAASVLLATLLTAGCNPLSPGGTTSSPAVPGSSPDSLTAQEFGADREKQGAGPTNETPPMKTNEGGFAADREGTKTVTVAFDGKRAMDYLVQLCKIGPRISGSEGMTKQQELLQTHFEKLGGKITWQKFNGKQPSQAKPVAMTNMIVSWNPDAPRRIILCGHYDTRPIADQEPRRIDWTKPFLSANDGTSTVAFLMEMAHHMKDLPRKIGVDFVFFDGEEWIFDPERDKFFLGSMYFADEYKRDRNRKHVYVAAVLLDLFAGKGATYPVEQHSRLLAGTLVEDIWTEAKKLGVKSFLWEIGWEVQDDHLALNRVGIPAIDIIDFSYKHWHRLTDTPDNCSADSMIQVARVLLSWLQRVK